MSQHVQARRNQHLTRPSEYLYASTSTHICKTHAHTSNFHTYAQRATYTYAQPYTKEASARNPGRPAAWRAQPVEGLVYREPEGTCPQGRHERFIKNRHGRNTRVYDGMSRSTAELHAAAPPPP